jgi:ubiquinone/menaquinone biosynthesis C-methylase UbiE
MGFEFADVTEVPGDRATREQITCMYHRYQTAAKYCRGAEVLEVACGAGQGLGLLSRYAKRVVGGDYSASLLRRAQQTFRSRAEILRLDAHALPFPDASFDVLILFEAIYYLAQPEVFVAECRRLLRPEGRLIICSVNSNWEGFNPSPLSRRYFGADELSSLLQSKQFTVELWGAFPTSPKSRRARLLDRIRRVAVALHLIPNRKAAKEFLKRIFWGKLLPIPSELVPGMTDYQEPVRLETVSLNSGYKILYAIGRAEQETGQPHSGNNGGGQSK